MKKIIIIIILFIGAYSCTSEFEDINTDPFAPSVVPTPTLLTAAMQDLININSGLGYNKTFMLYSQQWSQRETTSRSLYDIGSTSSDWSAWYLNGLPELMNIIKLNSGDNKDDFSVYGKNENQIAVATILKVWAFHNITDTWGNVPYSETFDIDNVTPKYDKQEDIYSALIQELKDAVAIIDTDALGFASGDLMYDGDMNKWKGFANSLRARIALRMSEVNPTLAQAEVADALGSIVFLGNSDNAQVDFQDEEANANPLYLEFLTQSWTFISEPYIDLMNSYGSGTVAVPSDPRVIKYAATNVDNEYVGFPYGLTSSESLTYAIDAGSLPSEAVRAIDFSSFIMTYSELLFIKAEAEQRGWFGSVGDAGATYEQAITASMEQWEVDSTDVSTYLALPDVQYVAADWRELIGEQKHISLFTQGSNAWSEWRRLDFPELVFPENASSNSSEIPRRLFYPSSEASVNVVNLEQAIVDMGGDTFSTRMWWDQ